MDPTQYRFRPIGESWGTVPHAPHPSPTDFGEGFHTQSREEEVRGDALTFVDARVASTACTYFETARYVLAPGVRRRRKILYYNVPDMGKGIVASISPPNKLPRRKHRGMQPYYVPSKY